MTSKNMWTCLKCGEQHDDTFDSCWKCLTPRPSSARRSRRTRGTQPGASQSKPDQEAKAITFPCITCSTGLRFRLPLIEGTYRCGHCKTGYRAVKAHNSPLVFLIQPNLERNQSEGSDASQRPHRGVTPQVMAAFGILGLDETMTFEEVRRAYRELIKGYHPDKVSHLGQDLRRLAETKSKEINLAFKVLEKFYAD